MDTWGKEGINSEDGDITALGTLQEGLCPQAFNKA